MENLYRGPGDTLIGHNEVCFLGCPYIRGGLYEVFHCMVCWYSDHPIMTELIHCNQNNSVTMTQQLTHFNFIN